MDLLAPNVFNTSARFPAPSGDHGEPRLCPSERDDVMLADYFPDQVNRGRWVTAYTLNALKCLEPDAEFVLPVCSLGTPYAHVGELGEFVLPPLFHEALDEDLKARIVSRIRECFPSYSPGEQDRSAADRVRVVEMPPTTTPPPQRPRVLGFSVDTAVEEHGPHLPLATDTIQSYGTLNQLSQEIDGFVPGPPVEYGQLTWGLPFGFSVDLTAELLSEYVVRFADAVCAWLQPECLYVVDVHGSIVHRQAIVEGLRRSRFERWGFRWLHEPLVEFAAERNDQHAGGVETAIVEQINPQLLDLFLVARST